MATMSLSVQCVDLILEVVKRISTLTINHVCRFDHIFGVFRSSQGVMRRMDLIFVPKEQFAFGYLGWVGSRAYLRFLRTVVGARDMKLNSHRSSRTPENAISHILSDATSPSRGYVGVDALFPYTVAMYIAIVLCDWVSLVLCLFNIG